MIKHLPNELRREGKKLNNWKEMICFLKEEEEFINKVILRRSSSFKRNIEANTKKFNIPVKGKTLLSHREKVRSIYHLIMSEMIRIEGIKNVT